MRQEHVEFPSIQRQLHGRSGHSAARRVRFSHTKLSGNNERPLEVLDEAFADFTRIDSEASRVDMHCVNWELVASLSAQLKALDEQREQLSRLLESVDTLPA